MLNKITICISFGSFEMKKRDARIEKMIQLLEINDALTVHTLAEMLSVSEMTIRRDIDILKQKNIILDVPGVVVLNRSLRNEENYHLNNATWTHVMEKERIGKYAASLVENNDVILIDDGTTAENVARFLPRDKKITVFTYNLNILNTLADMPNIEIIFGGGYYHAEARSFSSPEAMELLGNVRANKAFSSAAGVHETLGVTSSDVFDTAIKKAILSSGQEKILILDSSKFGVVKSQHLANLDQYDRVITDTGLSQQWIDTIHNLGITLDLV